jgi:hypothetical protein
LRWSIHYWRLPSLPVQKSHILSELSPIRWITSSSVRHRRCIPRNYIDILKGLHLESQRTSPI